MPATMNPTLQTIATPLTAPERIELANQLYREFHTRCFWYSPRDLVITEDLIPFVMKGLRTHGGHRGFMLAAKLKPNPATPGQPEQENVAERYAAEGQAALTAGRYEEAEKAFAKLGELQPGVAEVPANLGLIYFKEGKF